MFIDARTLSEGDTIEADLAVVGAGPAGIAVAREFIGRGLRVCLLESGGFEWEYETQALYEGEVVGLDYAPLDAARLRYFGGTSNHWTGQCRPFEAIDFEERPWVPHSGWPFGKEVLDPYYVRAHALCELGAYAYDWPHWRGETGETALGFGDGFRTTVYQFSPPTQFGPAYRPDFEAADDVAVYLYANALELETDDRAGSVTALRCAGLEGPTFRVAARRFVLAMGGIEIPRLLLLSNAVQPAGLGNGEGLVGRFFMEHPEFDSGVVRVTDRSQPVSLYSRPTLTGEDRIVGAVVPTEETLRQHRLQNFAVRLDPRFRTPPGVAALHGLQEDIAAGRMPSDLAGRVGSVLHDMDIFADIAYKRVTGEPRGLIDRQAPIDHVRLLNYIEPSPNPDSRVRLTDGRDALGQRRVALDWRLNARDLTSIRRGQELLARSLGRAGIGRLRIDLDPEDARWPDSLYWGYHHMGTTRMHADPRRGVVDADARVHGVDNLYVAGSAVFPTYSYVNPTLTIVALALKLADHLSETAA
jgi:choline dehydrogenase-like flavoprotein